MAERSLWRNVAEAAKSFEQALRDDQQPRIESFLLGASELDRSTLLERLLAIEIELRQQQGDDPARDEYARRFSDHSDIVARVFNAPADTLQTSATSDSELSSPAPSARQGGLHVRCPHCHNPIEIIQEADLSDLSCPSCGSQFNMLGDPRAPTVREGVRNIGHFKLLEQVGIGHFGSVWKAREEKVPGTFEFAI